MKEIRPAWGSLDELVEFFDTQDMSCYWDQMPEVEFETETEHRMESRITVEPGKRSGKPSIRGMRITVQDVLGYLAAGMTEEEIIRDFPCLDKDDILACLAYRREHV